MESKKFEKYFRIAHVGGEGVLHSCLKLYAFELSSSPQSDDLAFHNFFAAPHSWQPWLKMSSQLAANKDKFSTSMIPL